MDKILGHCSLSVSLCHKHFGYASHSHLSFRSSISPQHPALHSAAKFHPQKSTPNRLFAGTVSLSPSSHAPAPRFRRTLPGIPLVPPCMYICSRCGNNHGTSKRQGACQWRRNINQPSSTRFRFENRETQISHVARTSYGGCGLQ